MREQEIKRLVKIVEESNIGTLEIARWGRTIKITKTVPGSNSMTNAHSAQTYSGPISAPVPAASQEPTESKAQEAKPAVPAASPSGAEIKSPMVGTFYRSPSPDADSYVEVGTTVKKGQVLCIIEAMKLMNEIESEHDGKIVEILVENAQPVEYNQPLFRIEPA